jgi:hypothetical protein
MDTNKNNIDPSKMFADIMQQFINTGVLLDAKFIKKLLSDWKIKDLRISPDGKVMNEYAITELVKLNQKLCAAIPVNTTYAIISLSRVQSDHSTKDMNCTFTLYLCMLCSAIFRYYANRIKKPSDEQKVLIKLTNTVIDNIIGCLTSYMSGDYLTVIQKLRIIYESYIIFLFINKHKELVPLFLEHIKIIEKKIFQDHSEYVIDQAEISILDFETDKNDIFCWAKSIIPERKERHLETLANDVGIVDEMSVFYKLSSNFIHTNAFTAFIKDRISQSFVSGYLPIISTILIRQLLAFIEAVNPTTYENQLFSVLLHGLELQFFPVLFKNEIANQEKEVSFQL